MKFLLILTVLFSLSVMAQSSKSIEAGKTSQNPEAQKSAMEDQKVRQELDRKEKEAENKADEQRQMDENRAEDFEPYQQSAQRP